MTKARQNLAAPILTFAAWSAAVLWMILHFG
jgi:hypothetical protein